MTGIMIYHIRSKYTAVGRKEIVMFFWLYAIIELLAIFLDSGIIPTASDVYPVRPCCCGVWIQRLIPVRSGLLPCTPAWSQAPTVVS
jgi:Chitin synthase export chaperone